MLNVTSATKSAYKTSSAKEITISFPDLGLTFDNDDVAQENLSIEEMLEANEYLTFVGCNASKATFSLIGVTTDLKNQKVVISIKAGDTETIPLFQGYVDEQTMKNYTDNICELVAYDILYIISERDVASWYINLDWDDTWTIGSFREALFEQIGLDVVTTELVNDDIEFTKQYSPVQLSALVLIKFICQINGVFGIINREGKFEFRELKDSTSAADDSVDYYRSLDFQKFTVSSIDVVTVRQTDQVEGVSYGTGNNKFIVQGNFFTYNLLDEELEPIAENLLPMVVGRSYIPFNATIEGYPWVEVGDVLAYEVYDYKTDTYTTMNFYVMTRKLSGINALMDNQSADGNKERTLFISSIQAQVDTIKQQIENIQGKLKKMELNYVTFYNEEEVDVGDGETKVIASADFAVSETCQLRIDMEYLLECETTESIVNNIINNDDLRVTLYYEYDSHILDIREPKETYQDGKHIIHTYYVLDVKNTQPHTWKVYMECDGGSVHIDMLQAQNTMLGLGTIKSDYWDGNIKVSDTVDPIPVGMDDVSISQISDAVTVVLIPPIRIELSDTVNAVEVNSTEVSVAQITDELDAELNP